MDRRERVSLMHIWTGFERKFFWKKKEGFAGHALNVTYLYTFFVSMLRWIAQSR
jgi:hypothetical protein